MLDTKLALPTIDKSFAGGKSKSRCFWCFKTMFLVFQANVFGVSTKLSSWLYCFLSITIFFTFQTSPRPSIVVEIGGSITNMEELSQCQ
jgi:hypothetical protein